MVFVVACAAEAPPPQVFDACAPLAITGDDAATIAGAVALWNGVGVTSLGETGGAAIPVVYESDAAPEEYGLYAGSAIYMNDDLDPDQRVIVLAHELGHAIGLVHVTDRSSVMNPGNLVVTPTAEDAATVGQRWGTCE
jgi:predicted Zn-dependent protease